MKHIRKHRKFCYFFCFNKYDYWLTIHVCFKILYQLYSIRSSHPLWSALWSRDRQFMYIGIYLYPSNPLTGFCQLDTSDTFDTGFKIFTANYASKLSTFIPLLGLPPSRGEFHWINTPVFVTIPWIYMVVKFRWRITIEVSSST